jgi:GT2 family glycosyltransferase
MKLNIVVVIPNWNGADYIGECLKSLQKQSLKPHIIVVENGSVDDSVAVITQACPEAEILKFSNNAGFAGGVNRGIKPAIEAGADYIALFNNDALADKDWLKHLVAAAEKHPEAGIITGKFMRLDKKHLDSTGDNYSTHAMPFPRGRNQVDKGQFDSGEYVFGATGGASLYRVKMLQEIGLFDEYFFAYFEDVDISFRAQLAGWKVWYEPSARAYHHVSATSSRLGSFSRYHSVKNCILTYNKNMPGVYFWRYKIWMFERLARMLVGALRDHQLGAWLKGVCMALWLMPATIAKRHHIQKNRKVTPAYINSILYQGPPPKIPKL